MGSSYLLGQLVTIDGICQCSWRWGSKEEKEKPDRGVSSGLRRMTWNSKALLGSTITFWICCLRIQSFTNPEQSLVGQVDEGHLLTKPAHKGKWPCWPKLVWLSFSMKQKHPEDLPNPRLLGLPLLQEVWAESQESAFLTHGWWCLHLKSRDQTLKTIAFNHLQILLVQL